MNILKQLNLMPMVIDVYRPWTEARTTC